MAGRYATSLPGHEGVEELAHDARNMVTALTLYCDLLAEPGVLMPGYRHYAAELRVVADASRKLVDKLARADGPRFRAPMGALASSHRQESAIIPAKKTSMRLDPECGEWISDLGEELHANRNLLVAIAGPSVSLDIVTSGRPSSVKLTSEDLTRLMVNLVKNAADAMSGAGSIGIRLGDADVHSGMTPALRLVVEDDGPGIPEELLERVFDTGFTKPSARVTSESRAGNNWQTNHRGLGLAIVRSIVEAAGGRIQARNGAPRECDGGMPERGTKKQSGPGARIEIELPIFMR